MDDERIPPCLAELGLGTDADERALRRTYAQRLKRIDPATDPRAFQALREAYEQAQQWLWMREQARQAEAEAGASPDALDAATEPAAPTSEPAAEPSISVSDGTVVYEAFAAVVAQGFSDEGAARQALQAALADERLINLDARALFEWNVGCLLMNGWQRGHECLFTPAAELFGWASDRRHLQAFGRLGAAIDRAIDEKLAFFSQPRTDFDIQRRLIQRLRSEQMPSDVDLRLDVPLMHTLIQRYPNWLRAITSVAHAQRWRERFDQLPDVRYESAPAGPAPAAPPGRSMPPWLVMSGLMLVLAVMARLIGSDTRPPRPPSLGAPPPVVAPWTPPAPPRSLLWKDTDSSFEAVARPGGGAAMPAPDFQVPVQLPVPAAPASAARRAAAAASSGTGTSPPRPGR